MTIRENENGELFDDKGTCIWPTITHPKDRKFYLDNFKNKPDEWCRGNSEKTGVKHRVIFIFSTKTDSGDTYCERQCFDCGKKVTLGFKRIPTGIN